MKYPISDWQVAEIRRYYQQAPIRGGVKRLAERLGLPMWKVSQFAQDQGFARVGARGPAWTDAEDKLLMVHYWKTPRVISRIFKTNGYSRSPNAVSVRRSRLQLRVADADVYTARGLADCMGVEVHTVMNWVKKGLLRAGRKGTNRADWQGDIYVIYPSAVRDFLIRYTAHWDHRKTDKFWLVDILSGQTGEKLEKRESA
ncbi:MAG TPA: hypothetical protein VLS27_00200 [Gammaproteobacteria bacterium]|nr:hypothetical protein [Gammaproteobacteria bacterium]